MHIIDLSCFVKIYRSKNKRISVNFLRHFHRPGDLHLSGTTRCIYEDVIMKKCLTLLIATVLSGISLTAYAAQPMSNLDSGQLPSEQSAWFCTDLETVQRTGGTESQSSGG